MLPWLGNSFCDAVSDDRGEQTSQSSALSGTIVSLVAEIETEIRIQSWARSMIQQIFSSTAPMASHLDGMASRGCPPAIGALYLRCISFFLVHGVMFPQNSGRGRPR